MTQELILTFHGIGTPPDTVPENERPYWATPDQFREIMARIPEAAQTAGRSVLVTFDDGNTSDLTIAADTLRDHGLRGIFFPCSGRIGQADYLSGDDIRALHGAGFGIGSHGVDHVPWNSLNATELDRELGQSKEVLTEILGEPVTEAALPFGGYNRAALAGLRRHGYTAVYSSDRGLNRAGAAFRYRVTYRQGMDMDIAAMVTQYSGPKHRLVVGLKRRLKSLR